uniref:CCHC-type domain-containing protein n=1 Tax=Aegilops tauschii subsp. strangulata TaxID=200361 RepID=A0A453SCQ9_AEGTS
MSSSAPKSPVAKFQAAYAGALPTMTDRTQWEQVDLGFMVYPPVQEKRPPGRPRVQRIRGFLEDPGRKVVKCKKCGRNGHFAKTCNLPPLVIAEPPPMEHTPTKREREMLLQPRRKLWKMTNLSQIIKDRRLLSRRTRRSRRQRRSRRRRRLRK